MPIRDEISVFLGTVFLSPFLACYICLLPSHTLQEVTLRLLLAFANATIAVLFIFLRNALALLGYLNFHVNFRIMSPIPTKKLVRTVSETEI